MRVYGCDGFRLGEFNVVIVQACEVLVRLWCCDGSGL